MNPILQVTEILAAEGVTSPRVSLADVQAQIVSTPCFNLADAMRGLGLEATEEMRKVTICAVLMKNGFVAVGNSVCTDEPFDADRGAQFAFTDAVGQVWPAMAYALADRHRFSPTLRGDMELELAGLPAGRTDVNPTVIPSLEDEPLTYVQARTATVPVDENGQAEAEDIAAAWADVRRQIAEAKPPFPAHMIGYTIKPEVTEGESTRALLTVYAN